MKQLRKSKPFLVIVGIILGVALFNWGFRVQCNRTYKSLVSNVAIVNAFSSGDKKAIDTVVKAQGLAYQQIIDGKLKYSSAAWLPNLDIISYKQTPADGVILPDTKDSLKSRQPYRLFKNWAIYIAAPICSLDCQKEMFIVYKRAAL